MTKAELEKKAREYLAEHSEYSEVFGQTFVAVDTLTAMVDFTEPREKQIQIDAEQIRALQRQNGELTDKVKELQEELEQAEKVKVVEHFEAYGQCRDSRRIAELEAQIEKMKGLLEMWYNQHSDKTYTETFYERLIKATEEFLWTDIRR